MEPVALLFNSDDCVAVALEALDEMGVGSTVAQRRSLSAFKCLTLLLSRELFCDGEGLHCAQYQTPARESSTME